MNRIEQGNQRRAGKRKPAPANLPPRSLALAIAIAFAVIPPSGAQQRDLAAPELSTAATNEPGPGSANGGPHDKPDFPGKGKPFGDRPSDRRGNVLQAQQIGQGNALDALQRGVGNLALIWQSGDFNRVDLQQVGSGNTASVTQNGSGRTALIEQYGDDNRAQIVQGPGSPNATVRQHGHDSAVTLIQY